MNIIQTQNLCFGYSKELLLMDLNMSIEASSFTAIAGPNGVGKSTLLNLFTGILKPDSGRVLLQGKPLHSYSIREIAGLAAYVPQQVAQPFSYTVQEFVMMARFFCKNRIFFETVEDLQAVHEALEWTDTADLAARPVNHLSGGERQRVYIARALVQDTPILLLDEPTSHLDWKHQVRIYDLLKQLQNEKGKTIVTVSHDLNLAAGYCDRMVLIGKSKTAKQGRPEKILDRDLLKDIFDVNMLKIVGQDRTWFFPSGEKMK